jgi:flagellar M-ring protein FliF
MPQLVALSSKYAASLAPRARFLVAGLALAAIALAVGLAYYVRNDGTELYPRPLDSDQVAEVTAALTTWDVPFTPTSDNVKVDPAVKRDALMRLAAAGVPHRHLVTSSESLQAVNALTPQALLDAQVRTGLEGDLSQGLRGITGVLDARVKIAPASHGVFIDEQSHDASASVVLTLDPEVKLSAQSVGGIRSYVAGAVPGLSPDHVGIIDQNGEALSARPSGVASSEDSGLEATLQAALDRMLGPGQSLVIAHLETDQTAITEHEIKRVPVAANPITEGSVREHYTGKDKSYDKVRENTDRGSETVETNTQFAPGAPKRLSVAVFVDKTHANSISQISTALAAAAGINPARGDTLVVSAIAFAPPPARIASTPPATSAKLASMLPSLPYAVLVLIGAMVLASLHPTFGKQRVSVPKIELETQAQEVTEFESAWVYARLRGEPPHSAAAMLSTLPAARAAAVLELYDPETRREIFARLSRPLPPIVQDLASARLV